MVFTWSTGPMTLCFSLGKHFIETTVFLCCIGFVLSKYTWEVNCQECMSITRFQRQGIYFLEPDSPKVEKIVFWTQQFLLSILGSCPAISCLGSIYTGCQSAHLTFSVSWEADIWQMLSPRQNAIQDEGLQITELPYMVISILLRQLLSNTILFQEGFGLVLYFCLSRDISHWFLSSSWLMKGSTSLSP